MGAGQTRAGAQTAATTTARTRAAHKIDSDAIGGAFRSHLQRREVLKFGYVPMGDSASGEGFEGFHVLRYGRGRGLLGRRPPVVAARNETHFAPFATWDPRIGYCKPNVRRLGTHARRPLASTVRPSRRCALSPARPAATVIGAPVASYTH